MGDINSLLRFRKLPVFLLGNSARKSLISQKVGKRSFVPRLRYPVFFPVTRESGSLMTLSSSGESSANRTFGGHQPDLGIWSWPAGQRLQRFLARGGAASR